MNIYIHSYDNPDNPLMNPDDIIGGLIPDSYGIDLDNPDITILVTLIVLITLIALITLITLYRYL